MLPAADQPHADQDAPAALLAPLEQFSGTLGQRVHASLKHSILTLAYRPGALLRKPEICAQLGVSRSPVADAVARLAVEGLVQVVPQAGTFVARFSMAEIREGAFLREAIETAAAERVAGQITDAQIEELARSLRMQEALLGAGDVDGFYGLDAGMHELILSFTGFRRLAHVSETAWLHVNRARRLLLPMNGRAQSTLVEHQAIVAALAARDPDAARTAVRHHLRQLMHHLEPLERTRPELFDPS